MADLMGRGSGCDSGFPGLHEGGAVVQGAEVIEGGAVVLRGGLSGVPAFRGCC